MDLSVARHPRRLLALGYALGAYAAAGVTVPLFLLFAGDQLLPRTVDKGPPAATLAAVAGDVALLGLFGVQHSVMARPRVRQALARVVPAALVRSTYVLVTCVAVWALCLGWRPVDATLWRLTGLAALLTDASFFVGVVLVYVATLRLGHVHFLGLRPAIHRYLRDEREAVLDRLQVHGPYRLVRHPLMTGLVLCFWSASTLTAGRLLWAGGLTAYVLLGTALEERDLQARFGNAYRRYRAEVPAFIPWRPPRAPHPCALRKRTP